jgi:RNA polymerase sigma-70 factor (ECF subfamily)
MNDDALVREVLAGSETAAGELFDRHWLPACRVAFALCGRRSLAEEAAQDGLVNAFRQLEQFRGGRFSAWLTRIVVNRTLNLLRKEKRLVALDHADELGRWDEVAVADTAVIALVRSLPIERRTVVVLRYWLDYSPEDIAPLLGIPVGTVNSRLARALSSLRSELEVTDAGRA